MTFMMCLFAYHARPNDTKSLSCIEITTLYLSHFGFCECTSTAVEAIYLHFEVVNVLLQLGKRTERALCCLNRYKALVGDLLPLAVMECFRSIIHWLIP